MLLPRRAAPQKLASLDEYFVKDLRAEKHESKARGLAEEKREGAAIEESFVSTKARVLRVSAQIWHVPNVGRCPAYFYGTSSSVRLKKLMRARAAGHATNLPTTIFSTIL